MFRIQKTIKPLLLATLAFLSYASKAQVSVTATAGTPSGSYSTLGNAFIAINAGTFNGDITISLVGSTTETSSAVLNASGSGAASYSSVLINPTGAITVSGAVTGHLIDLNGADNVTIDGLNSGGNSLTINNTATGASSTIRFIADATSNSVKNCTLLGATTSFGTVYFATGTTTGNDNNTISNNNIGPSGASFATAGVYALGTSATIDNANITISNNNIFDYFSAGSVTHGINANTASQAWSITGNKFYQTAARTYTTGNTHTGINITTGNGYTINNNTIGYSSSAGTGTYALAGTVTTRFIGISLVGTAGTASSIQGNTITAMSINTSSGASTTNGVLCGISVTGGDANIGTITGNTIGSASAVNVMVATPTTTGGAVVGINCGGSANTINVANNIIGGFRSNGSTAAVGGGVIGVYASSIGSLSITNNTIGSSTPLSMHAGTLGTTTGGSIGYGIQIATAPSVALNISSNTVQNIASYGTGTAGFVRGIFASTSGSTPSVLIANNTVKDLVTTGAVTSYTSGQCSVNGIQCGTGIKSVIRNNTLYNLANVNTSATTNVAVAGISLASATDAKIESNTIYGLNNSVIGASATAAPVIVGILIRSGVTTDTVVNNMISLGTSVTNNVSICGIMLNHGSTPDPADKVYHNTINIEGTATTGAYNSYGIVRGDLTATARNLAIDMRNNLITNTRSGGTGKHYALGNNPNVAAAVTTNWNGGGSNNNILNANAATVAYHNGDLTLASWQSIMGVDAASFTGVSVSYVNSVSNLHLNMPVGVPTVLESNAPLLSGVTKDFDGDLRPGPIPSLNGGGTVPDFGADEFDGTPLDLSAPNITYTALATTCNVGVDRSLIATIVDASGVATSGADAPTLYFRINAGAYTAVSGTLVGTNQYEFLFGSAAVAGDIVQYYVVAQDVATPPNVGVSPIGGSGFTFSPPAVSAHTAPSQYIVSNNLAGTYLVGTGGAYPTLTAAAAAYNTSCLTGPVEFVLTDAAYNSAETFPITFNANSYASAINTLTIRPASTTTITGTVAAGSIIKLFGADYIIIDGSNSGGSSRDLTLQNLTTTTTGNTVVWIDAAASGNGATNNVVKNCIIEGNSHTTSFSGIHIGGSTTAIGLTTAGLERNDNQVIHNNLFRKTIYGVTTFGYAANQPDQNIIISNNNFGTVTDNLFIAGVWADRTFGMQVIKNEVQNLACTTGFSGNMFGLRLLDFKNGIAHSNNIHNIENTLSVSTPKIYGIAISSASYQSLANSSNALVYNNTVSRITSIGTSSLWNVTGILAGVGFGDKYYHNTVHLTGVLSASSAGLSCAFGAPDGNISGNALNLDVRNNIFNVEGISNGTGATNNFFAYYSTQANWGTSILNYNLVRCAVTAGGAGTVINNTGRINAVNYTTLASYQAASGTDANSINAAPTFASNTDLHLSQLASNAPVGDLGTPLATITSDIDNDIRSTTTPDMGADEWSLAACANAAGGTTTADISICTAGTLTIGASGFSSGLGTTYQWYSSTNASDYASNTGTPVSGQNNPALCTITTAITTTTYYWLGVSCSNDATSALSNMFTATVIPSVASVNASSVAICAGQSATLTENGGTATTWLWNPGAGTSASFSVSPVANTTYTVTVTNGGACTKTTIVSVVVNPIPSALTASPSSGAICMGDMINLNSTASAGQVITTILAEDFENNAPGWTMTDSGTSGANIALQNFGIRTSPFTGHTGFTNFTPSPGAGKFLLAYSDAGGSGSQTRSTFTSPSFSTIGFTGASSLSYVINFRFLATSPAENVTIQFSPDGGTTWNTEVNFSPTNAGPSIGINTNTNAQVCTTQTITIPASYSGLPNVKMRFRYSSQWGYWILFDNVKLEGNFVVSNTYAWSSTPGGFTSTAQNPMAVTPAGTTTYTVVATNNYGCTASVSTAVTVNPLPVVSATASPATIITGGTSTLTASGASTYTWNPGSFVGGTYTVSPTANTIYDVTGTDANGCTATSSVEVIVQTGYITAIGNVGCYNTANASIEVTDSVGLTSPITFSCANAAGPAGTQIAPGIFDGLMPDTYTITATDGTNTFTTTVSIANPAAVSASYTVVSTPTCFGGNDGVIAINAMGGTASGGIYGIEWYTSLAAYPAGSVLSGDTNFSASVANTAIYTVVVTDDLGCSATVSGITMTQPSSLGSNMTVNACDSFMWATSSTTYTATGVYYNSGVAANGCAIDDTLNLTITPTTGTSTSASSCNTYTWAANSTTYNMSGTYVHTVGCNHDTLVLTIVNSTNTNDTATACNTYTWAVNGMSYSTSGNYQLITTNAVTGCSDTNTLNLTINNPALTSTAVTQCNGDYTWAVNGMTYSSSGTYTAGVANAVTGCTDTAQLVLTINLSNYTSTIQIACDSFVWTANSMVYTTSGTYTHGTIGTNGCGDTAILSLIINASTTSTVTATSCNSYTWMLNGSTYNTSGTYTNVSTNGAGCPHTTTLMLTINNSNNTSTTQSSCDSFIWAANSTVYTASGTYMNVTTNVTTSCSDTATLILTINPSYSNSSSISAAFSATLPWGLTVTSSGTYTNMYTSVAGCDSLVSITVSISGVRVKAKAILSGPYVSGTGLMNDNLRTSLLPATEPYGSMNTSINPYMPVFTHVAGGGGEIVASSVLAVTGNNAIVDWVFVQLRSATTPTMVLATRSALLQRDGDIVDVDGTSPVEFASVGSGNYFVSVQHRNHLGIMSGASYALTTTATTVDLTTGSLYTRAAPQHNPAPFTGATRNIGAVKAMYAGNCNISDASRKRILTYNSTTASDRAALLAACPGTSVINGYTVFDCDLNGSAMFNGLTPDRLIILQNCGSSTSAIGYEQLP
jgi:trimeric autotransporter adhesin